MAALVTNNAWGELSVGVSDTATQLLLSGMQGDRFPAVAEGVSWFFATVEDADGNLEVVKCTARIGDTLTVERGQDNTEARAFLQGAKVELRPCAALFDDKVAKDEFSKTIESIRTDFAKADEAISKNLDDEITKIHEDYPTTEEVEKKFSDLNDTLDDDWVSKEYADDTFLPLTGGTLSGPLQIKSEDGAGFTLTGGDIRVITWHDSTLGRDVGGNITIDGTLKADTVSTSSDERMKENISFLSPAYCLEKVAEIMPISFRWKRNKEQDFGVLAQQIQDVVPVAVHEGRPPEKFLSVSYQTLIPLCIGAIQRLCQEVEELKK